MTQYKSKRLIKIKIFSNEIWRALCAFVFMLSIALCFPLLILNQTSGCCFTTWGDPKLHALLPASNKADSRAMFLCFLLSSTYCTLNTNVLINWHVAFEYLIGIEARIRVQTQEYFTALFYCLLPFTIAYKSPRDAIQSSSLVNLVMSICSRNHFSLLYLLTLLLLVMLYIEFYSI